MPNDGANQGMVLVNAAEYNALRECMVEAANEVIILRKRIAELEAKLTPSAIERLARMLSKTLPGPIGPYDPDFISERLREELGVNL